MKNMDFEKIEEEIFENGNRKINIGVRAYPELKLKLTEEAQHLSISLSEHAENILITHAGLLEKVNHLTLDFEELKEENVCLKSSLARTDLVSLNKKLRLITEENERLKASIEAARLNQQIFYDARLLYLFNKVKGQSDKIITDKGEINLSFNSPKDVLMALIYSYTL